MSEAVLLAKQRRTDIMWSMVESSPDVFRLATFTVNTPEQLLRTTYCPGIDGQSSCTADGGASHLQANLHFLLR